MAQPELPQERPETDGDLRLSGSRSRPRSLGRLAKTRVDLGRRLVAPLVVALVPLFWVIDATHRAALTTLGRDQGIFQYIAWAVSRGDVDYRDVRDVNGPLVHLIHMVMLGLGGADEHRFHVLELGATGIAFAIVGWCLPGIVSKTKVPLLERAAWAFAAWVVLMGQYHLYLYWNQAQRESFCDWFLLPAIALQLLPRATEGRGERAPRIVAIAALSTIAWFGKASFALFTVMQLAVLLVDRDVPLSRRAIVTRFALGGALGAVIPTLYLLVYGDLRAFLRITLVDVPGIYRFIWAKSAQEILGDEGPLSVTTVGLAVTALLVALVVLRELPRRVLALALAPPCALLSVLAQHKGFGYHFHPLTATTYAGMLLVVVMLVERFRTSPRKRPLGRYAALAAAAALALDRASAMRASPHTRNVWILAGGETPYRRNLPEYFATFRSNDFFPWEMRQAAQYIAERTTPDARVQTYGMDPYVLFLARRHSATPYIYAYDLNDDAALEGGWSNRPTDADVARIKAARDEHEHDLLARLKAKPPEVFVFMDNAPLVSYPDAWEDFRHSCPETSVWVATNYHPAHSFGEMHVWMRDDLPNTEVEKGVVP
jgi:hypothetical protein